MANLRGFTQGAKASPGSTIPWPSGTVAGDLALVHCGGQYAGLGPQTDGWSAVGHKAWWKLLTATDIANPLPVVASHVKLQTFYDAGGIGRTSTQSGITAQHYGSALWLDCARRTAGIAPSTYRLGTEWTDENGWYQAAFYRGAGAAGAYLKISGVASGVDCYAYEILPQLPPAAPIQLAPGAGEQVDAALPIPVQWLHRSLLAQQQRRLRISKAGVIQGWINGAGALVANEIAVTSSLDNATIAAGTLTAGQAYTWAVATSVAVGFGPYSPDRALNPVTAPTITSVTVAAPAEDLTPTVTVVATAGTGTLEAWRVWITKATSTDPTIGVLWDSGVISGTPGSIQSPAADWANGTSYKAWAQVWQTGGVSKRGTSANFTITWTPPAVPTVTITPGSPPSVTVNGITSGNQAVMEISSGYDYSWRRVLTRGATHLDLPLTTPGAELRVRAAQAATIDGVDFTSNWSPVVTLDVEDRSAYLIDSIYLDSYRRLRQRRDSDPERRLVQGSTISYGLGATHARVEMAPPAGLAGSIHLWVESEAEADELTEWLLERDTMWLRQSPDLAPHGIAAVTPVLIVRTSEIVWKRHSDMAGWRHLTIEWVQA